MGESEELGSSGKRKIRKLAIRTIIYAIGLEWNGGTNTPDDIFYLAPRKLKFTQQSSKKDGTFWKYKNPNGIIYRIKFVKDKVEFKKWLRHPASLSFTMDMHASGEDLVSAIAMS